jgi:hypothetical protein
MRSPADLAPRLSLEQLMIGTICVACGCSDSQACAGGCAWAAIDEDGNGLCTACAMLPIDVLIERAQGIFQV